MPVVEDGNSVTAGELQAVQRQAYQEAWAKGEMQGYQAGFSAGREAGYSDLKGAVGRLADLLDAFVGAA